MRSTSVVTTFGQDVTLLLLNPYHIISAVTALQAAIQLVLRVVFFCVLRDEHLAIHRLVYFASPAADFACYSAARYF